MKSLETFAQETASLDREAFLRAQPRAFLLLDPRKGKLDPAGQFRPLLPQVLVAGVSEEEYDAAPSPPAALRVLPLAKTRDRRFPSLVTFGRGPENDVVVSNPSLSKVHALFQCPDAGDCTVVDSRSTNGTVLEGMLVSSVVPAPLAPGAELVFGGAFRATFNLAEDLFEYIGVLRQTGKL